ncbi:hypothetical protein GEV33_006211 [Tenebrio molitor]|uniref:Uncharacterized protein n=1 Tax=Tenebrio molitor TaxID=7067 RepID=A0A8J6HD29_TENMO|nr:hypothetical protein GEV33_006211 [Tenebrio molitor]
MLSTKAELFGGKKIIADWPLTRHYAPPMSQRQLRSNRRGDPPSSSSPAQPTPAPPTSTSRLTTSSGERCSTCPRTSPTKTTSALSMESSSIRRNTPTPTNSKDESANNSPTPTLVNWNKTAFLITSLPLHDKFASNLIAATGSKTISCCPLKRKTEAPNHTGNDPIQKKKQLSVVVKGVDLDIDENDIRDQLDALPLAYKLIWRIKSRKTNKCTNLIRVTTENTNTVDFLLTHGLVLFGKHHECEPSKLPTPTPLQCSKCFQLGHHVTACPNKPACPKCPQTHAPNKCEAVVSTCLLCGGPHAAWSSSCPSIKTAPITQETPIAPTIVMNPPADSEFISHLNSAPRLVLSEHGLPMANTSTPPPVALSGTPTAPPHNNGNSQHTVNKNKKLQFLQLIQIFDYKKADWHKFRREISKTLPHITPVNSPAEIDEQINTFTHTLIDAKNTAIKTKTIPKNRDPLPARIVKAIKEKRKIFREYTRTRDPFLKTAHNRLNAIIIRDNNAYREETWSKACESLDYRDGKRFWNKFKALTGQKSVSNHHLVHNAQMYHSPHDKASCFAELLEEVHQVSHDPNFEDVFFQRITNNVNAFKNTPFTEPLPHPHNDEHMTDEITTDEVRPILLKNLQNQLFKL